MRLKNKLIFLQSYMELKNIEINMRSIELMKLQVDINEISESLVIINESINKTENELRQSMLSLNPIDFATRQCKIHAINEWRKVLDIKKIKYGSMLRKLECEMAMLKNQYIHSESLKKSEHTLNRKIIEEHNKALNIEMEELFHMRIGNKL